MKSEWNMNRRLIELGALLAIGTASVAMAATPETSASAENWSQWLESVSEESSVPVVQNREITKAGRFQLLGPLLGLSDRQDFHKTYALTLAARYHFSEKSAWEFLRVDFTYPSRTELAQEIQKQTSFRPDVQLSRLQIGSSWIYSPIYGKYAWNSEKIIYFDIFGRAGGGIRFAQDQQLFGELGFGMSHYLSKSLSLVPELRWRFYTEKRTAPTFISEGLLQLGVAWLF